MRRVFGPLRRLRRTVRFRSLCSRQRWVRVFSTNFARISDSMHRRWRRLPPKVNGFRGKRVTSGTPNTHYLLLGRSGSCSASGTIREWRNSAPTALKILVTFAMMRMTEPTERPPGLAPRLADDERRRRNDPGSPGTAVIAKTKPQTKRPSLYRVLLLNDDYTPMEFVVHVLERFFNKDHETAYRIMMHVHKHGIGECGIYTYEVAETKVTQVMDFSRKHQHPLQCVMEKK